MTRIAVPAVTLLLVVVGLVSIAGWNRSNEPRQRMTLTERELRLWMAVPQDGPDDPGVQLSLDYAERNNRLDARNWLTEDRLRAIGFVFDVMPSAPEAERTYGRALPRLAWVAFEYDGEAWRAIERQRAMTQAASNSQHDYRHGTPLQPSRLVPVDAAPDAETLLARYPNNHLILRASIQLIYVPPGRDGPLVYGVLRHVIPSRVHVPRDLRQPLIGLPSGDVPRYEADLAVGTLGLPYVTAVRRLQ
jgi:hypothetical protein